MSMQDLLNRFPDAEVITLNELMPTEDIGKGPWRLYIYNVSGFHEGGQWFRLGNLKYPQEEITFARAKQYAETAVGKGLEVRVCTGLDHLVFHAVNGRVVHGETFWNEASPDPVAAKVADRLKGVKK